MLPSLIKTMRPKQWAKNIFIFAPLVFDRQLTNFEAVLNTIVGGTNEIQKNAIGMALELGLPRQVREK